MTATGCIPVRLAEPGGQGRAGPTVRSILQAEFPGPSSQARAQKAPLLRGRPGASRGRELGRSHFPEWEAYTSKYNSLVEDTGDKFSDETLHHEGTEGAVTMSPTCPGQGTFTVRERTTLSNDVTHGSQLCVATSHTREGDTKMVKLS